MIVSYICAFKGARDDYQVPLALAETSQLECLVTDFYFSEVWEKVARRIAPSLQSTLKKRWKEGLSSAAVRSSAVGFIIERVLGFGRAPSTPVQDLFDALLSRKAGRLAARRRSNLFVYSPHAPYAFKRQYKHPIQKILFQFHPHWRTEWDVLASDQEFYRKQGLIFSAEFENEAVVRRKARLSTDDAWRRADLVFCASSFVRRSLVSEGAPPEKIIVTPYGVQQSEALSVIPVPEDLPAIAPCRALFVGTGIQRKGLHHLLIAWGRAKLPRDACLTVVCRRIDPSLRDLLSRTRQVELKEGVDAIELSRLYRDSSFFCMPSLIEGFGQVYLEALGHGLPILGTENTAVPDLGAEVDGVFCSPAGDVEKLIVNIERLADLTPGNISLRRAAQACAARFTWESFRKELVGNLSVLAPAVR
jgi:glycosyltransferase involved in cell wall biosynthesis